MPDYTDHFIQNKKRIYKGWPTSLKLLILLFFISSLPINSSGQGFLKTHGQAIVNESGDSIIFRGMGLGGWMLQEGYMLQTSGFASAQYEIRNKIVQLIGPEDTQLFYDAWLANHVRKIDIDSLASWGFNCIRLPMHYNLFTLPIEEEPVPGQNTWIDTGFDLTDSLLSWCAQNQIYLILDLHAAPGGQGRESGISDYDPAKPSLWESQANRDKTVALWKKLAERYASEHWIGGYDLINEPNWNMNGNTALLNLYKEITDSIRSVDTNHIVIIEGNWFANDFNGLTPPWDKNLVYSPHKYWSYNDQGSIQWVLDIRDTYNVPIFFGESGENSNTWFRNAIRLLEDNNIGWAWWPMKKVESISGPLSIIKTPEYQSLLDYWNGSGPAPPPSFTKSTLMELAENTKLENCIYQKDVIDAMFRQVNSDETKAFETHSIPGIIYASDYDMGRAGIAYFDTDLATYHVSNGNYTAWNKGWSYRNDGVDIEISEDNINSNGYSVGWLAPGEWMQYDINVQADAVYDVHVRFATSEANGKFHLKSGNADISIPQSVPNTNGWYNWQTFVIEDIILTTQDNKLGFYMDDGSFNLSSFEFIQRHNTIDLPTDIITAHTTNEHTIQLNFNKPLQGPIPDTPDQFSISVNGTDIIINNLIFDTINARIIIFSVDHTFLAKERIRISYNGAQIYAKDGTILNTFSNRNVHNTMPIIHPIPGKIEAEEYFYQFGIQLENTSDINGGQNIGYLDIGDYLDFIVEVAQSGIYEVQYRTASENNTGELKLQIVDSMGIASTLHTVSFAPTGGWQSWETTLKTVYLTAGKHHIRLVITKPQFNLNWLDFEVLTSIRETRQPTNLRIFPNPGNGLFIIQGSSNESQNIEIQVYNILGQPLITKSNINSQQFNETLDLRGFPTGQYVLIIQFENGTVTRKRIIKASNL